ncbi:MAG: elongation factor Ts [Parachlamydiaceae bacterium]|nr:elongation factor Ts [Parachlamydiaceae bacterium]
MKELRERTGVGMGKCKEALEEAKGDIELAISNLRKAGMASAVKKEGRSTNEGVIVFAETPSSVAVVEVNTETDFVARNERFQQFVSQVATEVAQQNAHSVEDFLQHSYEADGHHMTVDQHRATLVQAIGENIQIKRLQVFPKKSDDSIGVYSHLGGKIVSVVEISGASGEEALAKDIAMHIAAASPDYLSPEVVPADIIARERDVAEGQMKGKPANIIEKIIEGKLEAYYGSACLTHQKFVKNDQITIEQLVAQRSKEIGKPLKLTGFIRWGLNGG